jgi:hypothetical protein
MSPTPPRHLAFFLQELREGGVPRMTLNLAGELTRRGHRVTLLPAISGGVREDQVPEAAELAVLDDATLPRLFSRSRTTKQRVVAVRYLPKARRGSGLIRR